MRLKVAQGHTEVWLEFPEGTPVTVAQALQSLKDKQPRLCEHWYDKEGRLRNSLHIFINRENIHYRKGLETELSDGDQVYIIPMITGG